MKANEESVDAVRLMREIRDKMSAEMRDMSFEERREYIETRASRVRETLRKPEHVAGAVSSL